VHLWSFEQIYIWIASLGFIRIEAGKAASKTLISSNQGQGGLLQYHGGCKDWLQSLPKPC
jgi:hypothetical protein